jgi:hypothetical protein
MLKSLGIRLPKTRTRRLIEEQRAVIDEMRYERVEMLRGMRSAPGTSFNEIDRLAALIARLQQAEGGGSFGNRDLTEAERVTLIKTSREFFNRNPDSWAAITYYTGVAVGTELSITIKEPEDGNGTQEQPLDGQQSGQSPQETFDDVFNDPRNRPVFGTTERERISNTLLVEGEIPYAFFVNDESIIVRRINALEITDKPIHAPEDETEIWWYKREVSSSANADVITSGGTSKTLYYMDWNLRGESAQRAINWLVNESALLGDGTTAAIAVSRLPNGGPAELTEDTVVRMTVVKINTIGVRGYPLLKQTIDWIRQQIRFGEDRATVSRNRATYTDEVQVQGGQRAVDSVAAKFSTTISQGDTSERNPAPAAGSFLVGNQATEFKQRDLTTGAGDAEKDARYFRTQVAAGVGIPMALLYMDAQATGSLNAIIEIIKRSEPRWASYAAVWKAFYEDFARFVMVVRKVPEPDKLVVDVDTPPISSDDSDLKGYVESLELGKMNSFTTAEEAARLYGSRIGSNNLEDILKQLFPDEEEHRAATSEGAIVDPVELAVATAQVIHDLGEANGKEANGQKRDS